MFCATIHLFTQINICYKLIYHIKKQESLLVINNNSFKISIVLKMKL